MRIKLLVLIGGIVFLTSCNNQKEGETTLKLNWIYTGSFAPEALASKAIGPKNGLTLNLEPGGQGKDPLKLLNKNQFGIASADEILRANDKGGDFVIVGVVNHNSPTCFISLEKDSISSPKDFEGKKVGILPFGSTGLIYNIMMKKNNVDRTKIQEVTVYPDLKIFLSGNHQVQPAFVYDETVTLDAENVPYSVIEPKDFGVSFRGACYFTTKSTVEENPELVKKFVSVMVESIEEAINNPTKAIQALKEVDNTIDESRELKVWEKGIPYFKGYNSKPLSTDLKVWEDMVNEMVSFGELSKKPLLRDIIMVDSK